MHGIILKKVVQLFLSISKFSIQVQFFSMDKFLMQLCILFGISVELSWAHSTASMCIGYADDRKNSPRVSETIPSLLSFSSN